MWVPDGAPATAFTVTGDATVDPEAGEQMVTTPAVATQLEVPPETVNVTLELQTLPRLFQALITRR
jgi:hypothetical protein